jgi:putative oxidoreductase
MDAGSLVLHGLVGLLFVGHGAQKLFGAFGGHGLEGTAGMMDSLGFKPGRLHALASGSAEFAGGILLALGLLVPLAAALIIAVMLVAIVSVHLKKGIWNQNGGIELPLVYGAIAFALTAVGPGDVSLDSAFGLDLAGLGWALGALAVGLVGGAGALASGRMAAREHTPAHASRA